jgi:hypothetical protein
MIRCAVLEMEHFKQRMGITSTLPVRGRPGTAGKEAVCVSHACHMSEI